MPNQTVQTAMDELVAQTLQAISDDRNDLVALCLDLGNTRDYPGEERPVAERAVSWMQEAGFEAYVQPISRTSANAVGRLRGSGREPGRSLILNAHLDTQGFEPRGGAEVERKVRGAWADDRFLFGQGLANDKAQLAAQMIAARALKRNHTELSADLWITGVAQETSAPLGEEARAMWGPTGPRVSQIREGHGARCLIESGVMADFALVAEVSDFRVSIAQAGYVRFRVTVSGTVPYTPALRRDDHGGVNPFERAGPVIQAVVEWAKRYEAEHAWSFAGGTIVPKAQIYEIGPSGPAWTEPQDHCYLFLDVRLTPVANPAAIGVSLERHIETRCGLRCPVEAYDFQRGYVATGADDLLAAISDAHRAVHASELGYADTIVHSMWRDANAFNAAGIPAIGYGPPTSASVDELGGTLAGLPRPLRIDDVVATAQVIALTALQICGASAGAR